MTQQVAASQEAPAPNRLQENPGGCRKSRPRSHHHLGAQAHPSAHARGVWGNGQEGVGAAGGGKAGPFKTCWRHFSKKKRKCFGDVKKEPLTAPDPSPTHPRAPHLPRHGLGPALERRVVGRRGTWPTREGGPTRPMVGLGARAETPPHWRRWAHWAVRKLLVVVVNPPRCLALRHRLPWARGQAPGTHSSWENHQLERARWQGVAGQPLHCRGERPARGWGSGAASEQLPPATCPGNPRVPDLELLGRPLVEPQPAREARAGPGHPQRPLPPQEGFHERSEEAGALAQR